MRIRPAAGVLGGAALAVACGGDVSSLPLEEQLLAVRQGARSAMVAGDSAAWRRLVTDGMAQRSLRRVRGSFGEYARRLAGEVRDDGLIPLAAQVEGDTATMTIVGSPRMPFGEDPDAYQGEGAILMSTAVFALRFVRQGRRWKLDEESPATKPAWMPLGAFLRTRTPQHTQWPTEWSPPYADRQGERGLGADDVMSVRFATDSSDLYVRMDFVRPPVGSRELLLYLDTDHDSTTGQASGTAMGPVIRGWERRLQRSTRGFEIVTAEERQPRVAVEFTDAGGWLATDGVSMTFRVPWDLVGVTPQTGFTFVLVDSFSETPSQVMRGVWIPAA